MNLFSTVTKLVDLLAITYSGHIMDPETDFERRVASWEQEAKETSSDLINIGVVIKGLEKSGFWDRRKKTEYLQNNQWDGLARTIKPKASPGKAKANKTNARQLQA